MFPGLPEEEAMARLWDAIFETVRIKGSGSAVSTWRQHLDTLSRRKALLNEYHFKYLHYTNALGTDLTIQLPEDHLWAAGNSVMKNGVEFVANMPTEEIFTAPLKTGINGVVYAALPLVNDGNIIDKFYFVIREGKIVEAHAEKGEEFLKAAISVDEGASYFGEVALCLTTARSPTRRSSTTIRCLTRTPPAIWPSARRIPNVSKAANPWRGKRCRPMA